MTQIKPTVKVLRSAHDNTSVIIDLERSEWWTLLDWHLANRIAHRAANKRKYEPVNQQTIHVIEHDIRAELLCCVQLGHLILGSAGLYTFRPEEVAAYRLSGAVPGDPQE